MEKLEIEQTAEGFKVLGIPDAIHLVRLDNQIAIKLAHVHLHRRDLIFAKLCLEKINLSADEVIRECLWESAIIHLNKCFDTSSKRQSLNQRKIYGNDPVVNQVIKYFKNLRNKHLIHDENSYSQSIPCATLNDGKKEYKIEKILTLTMTGNTLEQANYSNLSKMIEEALTYVDAKFEELCVLLTNDLERKNYTDLINLPPVTYNAPTIDELHTTRLTPW